MESPWDMANLGGIQPTMPPGMQPPAAVVPPEMLQAQPQQQAQISAVTQPLEGFAPANDPAVLEQRKSGWQNFFNGIRDNPGLQNALLYMGQAMARGAPMADAIAIGHSALQMTQQNVQEQERQKEEFALKKRESEARIGQSNAATASSNARTDELKYNLGLAKKQEGDILARAKVELSKATSDAEASAIKARVEKQLADNNVKLQQIQADIRQSDAAAGASRASAANSSASAASTRGKTSRASEVWGSMTDEEKKSSELPAGVATSNEKNARKDQEIEGARVYVRQVQQQVMAAKAKDPNLAAKSEVEVLSEINPKGLEQFNKAQQMASMKKVGDDPSHTEFVSGLTASGKAAPASGTAPILVTRDKDGKLIRK